MFRVQLVQSVHATKMNLTFTGMHFSQAVASIQSLVGVIRGVHIVYREGHKS